MQPMAIRANDRYSEMRTRDKGGDKNISWSSITVAITDPYYEQHREKAKESFYITFCNIGGAFEAYMGASIVAFAEIAMYSMQCCALLKRRRKARRIMPYVQE